MVILLLFVFLNLTMKAGGPVIAIDVSPNDTVCLGDAIVLSFASSVFPTQFQYYISGGVNSGNSASATVLFSTPGQYTVTVFGQAQNGTGWASRIVTVLPSPNVSLNLPFDNVCQNEQYILSGGSPANGLYWGTCVSQNTFSTSCNLDSTYIFYTFIDSMGCENVDSNLIKIENCISIEEFDNERNLIIYPNPIKDNVTIELRNNNKSGVMDVFDCLGKKIFTQLVYGKAIIDMSEYPNGFYIFKWISDSDSFTKKIVVQH